MPPTQKIILYLPQLAPRAVWIWRWILQDGLGLNVVFTDDFLFFNHTELPKIAYGTEYVEADIWIESASLVWENDLKAQPIQKICLGDTISFFQTQNTKSCFPADLVASAFFLLSRYEEYLPHKPDSHGRFESKNSLAAQFGFLQIPMVNLYLFEIGKLLQKNYPALKITYPKPNYIPILDIDHPFYTKAISPLRALARRLKNWSFSENDKYDTYDLFLKSAFRLRFSPIFFALCPEENHSFDYFIDRTSIDFTQMLHILAAKAEIGIHPSYLSIQNNLLNSEISFLESVLGNRVEKSRNHFLRLNAPDISRFYENSPIKHCYSLQYPDTMGFRTSTSIPYNWYCLHSEKELSLKIHTPCWMDASYFYYNSIEKGLEDLCNSIEYIQKYGGEWISCYHNDLLATKVGQNFLIEMENRLK